MMKQLWTNQEFAHFAFQENLNNPEVRVGVTLEGNTKHKWKRHIILGARFSKPHSLVVFQLWLKCIFPGFWDSSEDLLCVLFQIFTLMWNPRYFIAHLFTEGHVVKVNRSSWANAFNCYLLNNIIQRACEYSRLLYFPPLENLKRETLYRAKRPLKRLCFRRSFMRLHRSKSRLVDKSTFLAVGRIQGGSIRSLVTLKDVQIKNTENTWRKKICFMNKTWGFISVSVNSRVR